MKFYIDWKNGFVHWIHEGKHVFTPIDNYNCFRTTEINYVFENTAHMKKIKARLWLK